jgi:hypothetical protein
VRGSNPTPDAFFLTMYICYLDESGTVESTGSTTHFVLLGMGIPATNWKTYDRRILEIKDRYGLANSEIHTAWLLRDYPEQNRIPGFQGLSVPDRKRAVTGLRALNLARPRSNRQQRELLKNYRHTLPYIHMSSHERRAFVREVAEELCRWTEVVLFADAQDKIRGACANPFDMAFEQVVTRFNTFLRRRGQTIGLLVEDNNPTMASRLTRNMRRYHRAGTVWSAIDRIIETPLFVDSQLTSMVQIADLCAYVTRRFCEKQERELFAVIKPRFDQDNDRLVGIRHYTGRSPCHCEICREHGRT